MIKINQSRFLLLLAFLGFLGFENIIGQQLSSPQACIINHCNEKSLTIEELLEAGGIEANIPNATLTINVLKFSMSYDIDESGYFASQENSGDFTEKQIALIKKAPKGTKIYFGDIQADILACIIHKKREFVP